MKRSNIRTECGCNNGDFIKVSNGHVEEAQVS